MQPAKPFSSRGQFAPAACGLGMAGGEHAAHHEMMGHKINPYLPDWVNNLKMCGYCELLTLSPALILALLAVLLHRPCCLLPRLIG